MTDERYNELQWGPEPQQFTTEEIEAGWHWCQEMDDLLCLLGEGDCFCQGESPDALDVDFDDV